VTGSEALQPILSTQILKLRLAHNNRSCLLLNAIMRLSPSPFLLTMLIGLATIMGTRAFNVVTERRSGASPTSLFAWTLPKTTTFSWYDEVKNPTARKTIYEHFDE
jgi:hypothetical protein